MNGRWRLLELNGGRVEKTASGRDLILPPAEQGYADAQFDDYGGRRRADYPWTPGVRMRLRARFSHPADEMTGTAGFGFWNAPFGDPSVPWPALPQAVWFFFAGPRNHLPFAPDPVGHGWFISTLDATRPAALALAPSAPIVVLLNRISAVRAHLWPFVRRRLGIYSRPLDGSQLATWHTYQLDWRTDGSVFSIDGRVVGQTPFTPRGPLGFVCWMDNQYMVVTAVGRVRFGTRPVAAQQRLQIADLQLSPAV